MNAKKDSSKAPKTFNQIRRTAVGAVRVIELEDVRTKRRYFRTECRRKNVTPKTKSFNNWKEAMQFATKQNLAVETGQIKETDDETIFKLKQLGEKINVSNILEEDSPYRFTFGKKKTSLEDVFEVGIQALKSIANINKRREEAGLQSFSIQWAMNDFENYENLKSKVAKAPKMKEMTRQLLAKKLSRTGGKGNRELEPKSKKEWKYTLERLDRWIGDCSMEEEKKILKLRVINGINSGTNESGKDKGEFWGGITKNRFASKANEFGNWMVDEEYWLTNPFKALPKEFNVLGNTRAVTFTAEEVKKLFFVAMKKQNRRLIPYMAFIFFSGARPYEIAGDKKERRFDYGDMMEWKQLSSVTGGVLFEVFVFDKLGKRKSKGARDRFADLAPAGVEWIKWYHKEEFGNEQLPIEGKVDYSRRIFDRIKKEALDYYWPPDAPRHTFTSLAHRNEEFKTNNANYWLEKCGHSYEIFQKRYNAPKTQSECEKYFNIKPSVLG
jgi:hypothetical protein